MSPPADPGEGADALAARLRTATSSMEGLVRLGSTLASREQGLNERTIAEALLGHLAATTALSPLAMFLFDDSLALHPLACHPASDQAVLELLLDEAIEQGAVASAIQNTRAVYDPRGDGNTCLLLRSLGTRQGELGVFAAIMPRGLAFALPAESAAALDAAVNLASHALETARLFARLARQNQELHDLVALRTKEFGEMARQAQLAERAKGDFLASMSHEIRTPLNGIIGLLDVLREDPRLAADQREHLQTVATCSLSLHELIDDILDLARMEAGKMLLSPVPFALPSLVEEVQQVIGPVARRKGLAVSVATVGDADASVFADPRRIRQILLNLLANAVKYTERGQVSLECSLRRISPGEAELRCTVADTGIGISEDERQRIFEAFYQVGRGTNRSSGGSGLGLAICAKLVQLMSGRIEVAGEPGKGSTFTVHLPLGLMEAKAVPPADPDKAAGQDALLSGRRLLVVEDNLVNQKVVTCMLAKLGCTITTVDSGAAALAALERDRYDLVFMDIEMPVLDGYQTTTMIREREQQQGGHVPIVALTAHALDEHRRRAAAAGMDDYLPKPINRRVLLDLLRRHLAGKG